MATHVHVYGGGAGGGKTARMRDGVNERLQERNRETIKGYQKRIDVMKSRGKTRELGGSSIQELEAFIRQLEKTLV